MTFFTDIVDVGRIVPLPNHYMSDMPQGAWAGIKPLV
jgi:hypothetical protein